MWPELIFLKMQQIAIQLVLLIIIQLSETCNAHYIHGENFRFFNFYGVKLCNFAQKEVGGACGYAMSLQNVRACVWRWLS